jgi:UDP-GlcNAc:undecaprenyl-phosphate GlcNAc-1-phosphate transferase
VVVVKRLRRHRPLMLGDRNHISHRLRRLGLSSNGSLLAVVALQAALAGCALLLREITLLPGIVVVCQAACILTVAILLEARRDHGD